MPELPTLTVTAPNGTVRDTLTGIRAERDRHVTDRSGARFVVDADRWQTVADSINRRADRFRIDAAGKTGWFGGRFRDTERGSQQVTVILDDYERDARDAEPTGGQVLFQNVDDATVVQDALSRIPTLSAGTIQTVASGLSFSFSNAEPAKMIRDAAQPGGALVRYNADRTVDFVARPTTGGEPELSTAANTLVGEPDVSDDNRNPPTEIIGLGAQSGPNQVRATATVDPTAEREVYRRYENKDIQQQNRLQTTVDRLAGEVAAAEEKLDAEAGAINLDVRPGDPLAFVWPARGIDETVRVIEFTEVINERGRRYAPLRVSNRWPEQGGSDKAIEDLERFNRGYQGFIDRAQAGGDSRQPVDTSLNSEASVVYPDDVVDEITARVFVEGLAYRSYSQGSIIQDFTATDPSPASGDQNDLFLPADTVITLQDVFPSVDTTEWFGWVEVTNVSGSEKTFIMEFFPEPDYNQAFFNIADGESFQWVAQHYGNADTLAFRIESVGEDATVDSQSYITAAGAPTVSTNPGVVEEFDGTTFYPSNCDVLVNGTSMGVSLGDGTGEFEQFVDIRGELTPGTNTVEVTSDSLGHIRSTVETELFRQGREDTA